MKNEWTEEGSSGQRMVPCPVHHDFPLENMLLGSERVEAGEAAGRTEGGHHMEGALEVL